MRSEIDRERGRKKNKHWSKSLSPSSFSFAAVTGRTPIFVKTCRVDRSAWESPGQSEKEEEEKEEEEEEEEEKEERLFLFRKSLRLFSGWVGGPKEREGKGRRQTKKSFSQRSFGVGRGDILAFFLGGGCPKD